MIRWCISAGKQSKVGSSEEEIDAVADKVGMGWKPRYDTDGN
jgi:hypothetical protein